MKKVMSLMIIMILSMVSACGSSSGGVDSGEPEVVEAEAQAAEVQATEVQAFVTPTSEPATATPEPTQTTARPVTDMGDSSPLSPPVVMKEGALRATPSGKDKATPLPGTEELVAAAKKMLSQTPGVRVATGEVSLRSIERKEWSDGSLGCPQEGMAYIQVITPGYLLILEAGGQDYEFHTNTGDQVVPCFDK